MNWEAFWGVTEKLLFRDEHAASVIHGDQLIFGSEYCAKFSCGVAGLSSPNNAIEAGENGAIGANRRELIDR